MFFKTIYNQSFQDGCDDYFYYNSRDIKLYKPRLNLDPMELVTTEAYFYGENYTTEPTDPVDNISNYLPLYDQWQKYYKVPVSLNASTIHVPVNVYECGKCYTLITDLGSTHTTSLISYSVIL